MKYVLRMEPDSKDKHPNHQYIEVLRNNKIIGRCYYVMLDKGYIYGLDRTYSSGIPTPKPTSRIMFQAIFDKESILHGGGLNRVIKCDQKLINY